MSQLKGLSLKSLTITLCAIVLPNTAETSGQLSAMSIKLLDPLGWNFTIWKILSTGSNRVLSPSKMSLRSDTANLQYVLFAFFLTASGNRQQHTAYCSWADFTNDLLTFVNYFPPGHMLLFCHHIKFCGNYSTFTLLTFSGQLWAQGWRPEGVIWWFKLKGFSWMCFSVLSYFLLFFVLELYVLI